MAKSIYFNGDWDKYELWEIKFLGQLRLQNLLKVVTCTDNVDTKENAKVFSQLAIVLNDRSLSLIINDAKDDGRKAIGILRDYYLGKSKPRLISLYTELTTLKLNSEEDITNYIIRAERASNALKNAGENFSDSLLVAVVLKGLSEKHKTFSTVISQREKEISFSELKLALRGFEETEKFHNGNSTSQDNVMKRNVEANMKSKLKCFSCGKVGHKQFQCKNRKSEDSSKFKQSRGSYVNRWCDNCKSPTHDTRYCRKNNSVNSVKDNNNNQSSFAFNITNNSLEDENESRLLVDCGASTHIICDESMFENFNKNFDPSNHYLVLADSSKNNNLIKGKGDARVTLYDSNGNSHKIILKNALYIPSLKQYIFSAQSAAENGVSVNFTPTTSNLVAPNGTIFEIEKRGKLYYQNNVCTQGVKSLPINEWHKILGHCNVRDIFKLESVVEGTKIINKDNFNCITCILGKMTENKNRKTDKGANGRLKLIHCDLAGPIDPISMEGHKYAISFIDDYSGIISVYALKNKSDVVAATEKYLSDVAPFGNIKRMRFDNATEFRSSNFRSLLIRNKIRQEFCSPYSPFQNGTAERSWRTIFEM